MPKPTQHDHKTLKFPKNFLWGTATSAHQVEGGNTNNDWWRFEQTLPESKRSGIACDQYNRFDSDFHLAKTLGQNSHRLSLEWSRIEPRDGEFDSSALKHYFEVLKSLKDNGFSVMLTLHHFTNPLWFSNMGGWQSSKACSYFLRYVKRVTLEYKDLVDLWITINEPTIIASDGYITGKFPPFKKNKFLAFKVLYNLASAHKLSYKLIHQIIPEAKVGLANNVTAFDVFHKHSIRENLSLMAYDYLTNHLIYTLTGKSHDFLGLNSYNHQYISINGHMHLPRLNDITEIKEEISDMGWEIYPEGLLDILLDFSNYKLPIYITENGVASSNDDRRVRFLLSYLKEIYHGIRVGLDIGGYFYWSLLDNFEWTSAFEPQFGLIEVMRETMQRKIKPSALVYKEIIRNNGIPHYLLKLLGHGIQVKEVIG